MTSLVKEIRVLLAATTPWPGLSLLARAADEIERPEERCRGLESALRLAAEVAARECSVGDPERIADMIRTIAGGHKAGGGLM